MPVLIKHEDLSSWLNRIHADWILDKQKKQISRSFNLESFYQTMAFANSVAWVAQQNNHHPEMHISYNTCRVEYSTHSIGGLSELDFKCAQTIDRLVEP